MSAAIIVPLSNSSCLVGYLNIKQHVSIAISYRKVNTLPYSSYVNECALSLAAEKNEPSDAYLIHHVGLLQILEEIRSTLGCDMSDSRTTVSEEKLNLYITAFESKLNDLKHKFPSSFLRPGQS